MPQIEKGIPLPERQGSRWLEFLKQLQVGDSFVHTNNSAGGLADHAKKLNIKFRYGIFTMPDGQKKLRVWRVA